MAATMVIMDPYQVEALIRFATTLCYNKELSSKADTLIDTEASLIFISKEFVMANDFYLDCKVAARLLNRVASEQRISTTKVFCRAVFTIDDGHEFTDLKFYNLQSYLT